MLPFESLDPVKERPLAQPNGPSGVQIRAVVGAPAGRALAAAMADAFTRRDVAATTGRGNLRSWVLIGRAEAIAVAGSGAITDLRLRWDLADAGGAARGAFDQRARVGAADWRDGSPDLLNRLAEEAALALLPRFTDANAPTIRPRTVTIHAIDGAPGDGATALGRALADALSRRGFPVSADIADGGFVVAGVVRMSPGGRDGDTVSILWTVLGPDGATLGTIEQNNRVPAGSLSDHWGIAAIHVAEAAAPGIAEVITRARPKTGAGIGGPLSGVSGVASDGVRR